VFENTKGIIRRRVPKKDRQEEFEDTPGVIRGVHRKRTYKESLKIQKD
jgi:hypothetical protein